MSKFGESRACNNSCGTMIYFDKNSSVGHPNQNTWIPLEIKEGRKTDVAHNCPKKKNGQTLTNIEETVQPADTLKVAESLLEILTDYIRLKTKEQGAVAAE